MSEQDQDRRKKPPVDIQLLAASGDGAPKPRLSTRLRNYFLTGLVIAAPISITVYITMWFVDLVDAWIKPLIPSVYNPDKYLPFSVPGVGLIFAIVGLTLLGALTANLVGRTVVGYGEQLLNRMPIVRNVYNALKQIFETVLSQSQTSFQDVGLIQYPRQGLYAIVFISTPTKGEIQDKVEKERGLLSVFLPTTPNPTSGFLLFVPKDDVLLLDMSVEEAAKLVISAGLVTPEYQQKTQKLAAAAKQAKTQHSKGEKPARKRQPARKSRTASSRSNK